MGNIIRKTRSVCPVCLRNISAELSEESDGRIYLEKRCSKHGFFRTCIWQGLTDFNLWSSGSSPLCEGAGLSCPENCGICSEHEIGSCCVLLEVTNRCNLRCRFCFANGGDISSDPPLDSLKTAVRDIVSKCGNPLLQLSGGEPTLRDDLPKLIRYAKQQGCSYVQVNTNGIRLARDPAFAHTLADAGLDIVFLQFDGTSDGIYEALRGAPLLETKLKAIEVCRSCSLGVTLVPTVVPGINDSELGNIVNLACSLMPAVRGIHFQPVSYFGRYPETPDDGKRYTLDRLMHDLSLQSGIPIESFMPSRCDHPLCGFHASFIVNSSGGLRALSSFKNSSPARGCEKDNREYVARHWIRPAEEPEPPDNLDGETDFDTFLYNVRHRSLTVSAMAFQDASNLNIERLHRCSLHVYDGGSIKPFCAKYLTAVK